MTLRPTLQAAAATGLPFVLAVAATYAVDFDTGNWRVGQDEVTGLRDLGFLFFVLAALVAGLPTAVEAMVDDDDIARLHKRVAAGAAASVLLSFAIAWRFPDSSLAPILLLTCAFVLTYALAKRMEGAKSVWRWRAWVALALTQIGTVGVPVALSAGLKAVGAATI